VQGIGRRTAEAIVSALNSDDGPVDATRAAGHAPTTEAATGTPKAEAGAAPA
jgi:hypothetical protein